MELLKPKFAVLDETDSGLDVDALRIVSEGVNRISEKSDIGVLLITHTTRLLRHIPVDSVYVFVEGKIAAAGDSSLADEIDAHGYEKYLSAGVSA
jgi:Fe-S cluster assembly ATP-binding protein